MAPTYKLYYFDTPGRGEKIRYIFAYAKQDFEDIRITKDLWPEFKKKTPYGQVPVLEIDGKPIAQSFSICRYLARKFNLDGKNELEALECDSMVETLGDLIQKSKKYLTETDPKQKEIEKRKLFEEDVPFFFKKFEDIVSKNGGYTVGSQITWSDFHFANILPEFEKSSPGLLKSYPALNSLIDKVSNLPSIKEWKEKSAQLKKYYVP
uniref:glutathione transferase n=1 Tax=Sitophilus oryzae TaxID=7048 RepID=A0A2S0BYZ7_SITOR|nr:glutathione-S-transferase sigma class 2 [Sitophilus oryzae]